MVKPTDRLDNDTTNQFLKKFLEKINEYLTYRSMEITRIHHKIVHVNAKHNL